MKKFLQFSCGLLLLAIVFVVAAQDVFNPPQTISSTAIATVVGGEYYPTAKSDRAILPKVRIRMDDGVELLFDQNVPINLKYGDKIKVIIWKRRFFGYRTVYERL